jgi:hypothetical protein
MVLESTDPRGQPIGEAMETVAFAAVTGIGGANQCDLVAGIEFVKVHARLLQRKRERVGLSAVHAYKDDCAR